MVTLNDLIRQQGELIYSTPLLVWADKIYQPESNDAIVNPPYQQP